MHTGGFQKFHFAFLVTYFLLVFNSYSQKPRIFSHELVYKSLPDTNKVYWINKSRITHEKKLYDIPAHIATWYSAYITMSFKDKASLSFTINDTTILAIPIAKRRIDTLKQDYYEPLIINDSSYFFGISFPKPSFNYYHFENKVEFDECFFDGPANFYNTTFKDSAIFEGSRFLGIDTYSGNNFNRTKFLSAADFNSCFFKDKFSTQNAHFSGNSFFDNAEFSLNATLTFTTFDSVTSFLGTRFLETVNFDYSNFRHGAKFIETDFKGMISFRGAYFGKTPLFDGAQLPKYIDFREVKFSFSATSIQDAIDLRKGKLDILRSITKESTAKCMLWVDGTDLNRFIIPFDRFKIVFTGYSSYEQKFSAYEALIKNSKEAGMIESVQGWDIEYRKLQIIHRFPTIGPTINIFNLLWWNYGYDRWRILVIWLPFFFFCFLIWNYYRINILWTKMYKDTELGSQFKTQKNLDDKSEVIDEGPPEGHGWSRFSFAFFYTAVIYFGFKIRHESVNYYYTRGLLYLYLIYAVGTIHMAFAFSYILSTY